MYSRLKGSSERSMKSSGSQWSSLLQRSTVNSKMGTCARREPNKTRNG